MIETETTHGRTVGRELTAQRVAFTGRLASMSRRDAIHAVEQAGGTYAPQVDQHTTLLVIGAAGWPLRKNGRLTRALLSARRLQRDGSSLVIEGEVLFLRRFLGDATQPLIDRYTAAELTEMLGISAQRLDHWRSLGLIRPIECQGRVAWFDFSEVRRCRLLLEMVDAGVPARRIVRNLRCIQLWSPDTTQLLDRIAVDGRRALVLDESDRWLEPHGQLLFDFADDQPTVVQAEGDILFQRALRCELDGRFEEAIALYRRLLESDRDDADIWFNLANAHSEVGDTPHALDAYREALRCDPEFVEAWHNFGIVLADEGCRHQSLDAFRAALTIDPKYSEAMFSAASVLDELGRRIEAEQYWRKFLQLAPEGDEARYARARLAPVGSHPSPD